MLTSLSRGKKVYHKLPEDSEGSEEIELDDLGLTQTFTNSDQPAPLRRIKPLKRRSIKPTRLFQSEKQIRDREAELEDEISTDVEAGSVSGAVKGVTDKSDEEERLPLSTPRKSPRSKKTRKDLNGSDTEKPSKFVRKPDTSPFDSWKRVKGGSPAAGRGKKRTSDQAVVEEKTSSHSKRVKSH